MTGLLICLTIFVLIFFMFAQYWVLLKETQYYTLLQETQSKQKGTNHE